LSLDSLVYVNNEDHEINDVCTCSQESEVNGKQRLFSPPIIVLINEACPGQSTSVNCISEAGIPISGGTGREKDENPRSRVIPRSTLCGFLSNAAVLAWVLKVFASEVFPLST
jgi:hypothetical protein